MLVVESSLFKCSLLPSGHIMVGLRLLYQLSEQEEKEKPKRLQDLSWLESSAL